MKPTRAAASIIIAAGILVLAYAGGLVIRSARQDHMAPPPVSKKPLATRTTQPVPVEKVEVKETKTETPVESREVTPEPKEQPKEAVVERPTPPVRPDVTEVKVAAKPQEDDPLAFMGANLSPKLRAMMLEKWNTMTDEQKEQAKKQWNEMPEEQKQMAMKALESMDSLPPNM
jgi:hypothetical protein